MSRWSRRAFLNCLASGLALSGCSRFRTAERSAPHVVVVGGGFAGSTCAKYLKKLDPAIQVSLIEPKRSYLSCPGSNWLLVGLTDWTQLRMSYQGLAPEIQRIEDSVSQIHPQRRTLTLRSGSTIAYDRLILAPGIDFQWDTLAGYGPEVAERFPHAWQAGTQTDLLARQLHSMEEGGVVIVTVPGEPYRCPPGPYERASLIAWWLKQHKPRSKVLMLDAKRSFSKQALFEQGWRQHFGYQTSNALIEWHSLADNPIVALDVAGKTLRTDFGDRFRGDVLNIIPPQQAGRIAQQTGLCSPKGWCAVEAYSGQSVLDPYIHIIGDAAQLTPLPKSAFAANSQAKVCALAVTALLHDQQPPVAEWMNTCYSLITPQHGISVAGSYRARAGESPSLVAGSGGVSSLLDAEHLAREARYARAVLQSICLDSF